MSRYIDVGGIKKHIIRDGNLIGERNYITFSELDEIPSADVRENVRGKWISRGVECCNTLPVYQCSVCGDYDVRYELTDNFCPNCGCDMRR